MITIQDWIATIPEEDRQLAYVGEHQTVTRQFLLACDGWQEYVDWGFHLDMSFDLSTVTTRDSRQLESTKLESSETVSDTLVKTSSSTTKEKYTVADVTVDCHSTTDIASLEKEITPKGLLLTWTVLRQHTQLPGRLWANIRALGPDGQVKKSAVMVFDVAATVVAEPAADLPQSELEAMEEHMDEMLDAVLKNTQTVESCLADTEEYVGEAKEYARLAELALINAQNIHFDVVEQVDDIQSDVQQVAAKNAVLETALEALTNEVEDARVTSVGSRYESLGEAVRGQIGGITMDVGRLDSRVTALEKADKVTDGQLDAAVIDIEELNSRVTALEEAQVTVDAALDKTSLNPVQNKVLAEKIAAIDIQITALNNMGNKFASMENRLNQLWSQVQKHVGYYPMT